MEAAGISAEQLQLAVLLDAYRTLVLELEYTASDEHLARLGRLAEKIADIAVDWRLGMPRDLSVAQIVPKGGQVL